MHVMRTLSPKAQASVGQRLGWLNFVDFGYPDLTYRLRLPSPDDCEVSGRFVRVAAAPFYFFL
eukprot:3671240-Pyramimonas_sp.AAC.1